MLTVANGCLMHLQTGWSKAFFFFLALGNFAFKSFNKNIGFLKKNIDPFNAKNCPINSTFLLIGLVYMVLNAT